MRSKREHVGPCIEVSVHVDAAPDVVYEAWADPRRIAEWFVDRAEGRAKAGEAVSWSFDYFRVRHPVPVVEAEPGRLLAFAGEVAGRPPFLQEFHFEPDRGGTTLRLRNSGFGEGADAQDELQAVESGWILAFATLRRWLETYDGRARQHWVEMRPAAFEFDALQPLYTTAAGLRHWLFEEARAELDPLALDAFLSGTTEDGRHFEGRVLARSERELLLDWPAEHGVLALKCFTLYPGQRAVCLDFNAWPASEGDPRAISSMLSRSLSRLVNHLEGFHDRPVAFKGWSWPKPPPKR